MVHQGRMVDGVETRLDVRVEHPPVAVDAEVVDLSDRVLGASPGPEPVGDRLEVGLEDWFQDQFQRALNDPIRYHGNPVDVGDRQAVDAERARALVTRDPVERYGQRRRITHEVE